MVIHYVFYYEVILLLRVGLKSRVATDNIPTDSFWCFSNDEGSLVSTVDIFFLLAYRVGYTERRGDAPVTRCLIFLCHCVCIHLISVCL